MHTLSFLIGWAIGPLDGPLAHEEAEPWAIGPRGCIAVGQWPTNRISSIWVDLPMDEKQLELAKLSDWMGHWPIQWANGPSNQISPDSTHFPPRNTAPVAVKQEPERVLSVSQNPSGRFSGSWHLAISCVSKCHKQNASQRKKQDDFCIMFII